MVRNFQLWSNTFTFLLSTKAGTGNLITKKNSEHFGLILESTDDGHLILELGNEFSHYR